MYSNTTIKQADIDLWIMDFQAAKQILDSQCAFSKEEISFLRNRILDALFLVAFVESHLAIEVADEVYDRARELQRKESD